MSIRGSAGELAAPSGGIAFARLVKSPLFVGGVMNTIWIVFLAFLILLEKITFSGPMIARLAGIALVSAGVWLLSMPMS